MVSQISAEFRPADALGRQERNRVEEHGDPLINVVQPSGARQAPTLPRAHRARRAAGNPVVASPAGPCGPSTTTAKAVAPMVPMPSSAAVSSSATIWPRRLNSPSTIDGAVTNRVSLGAATTSRTQSIGSA